MTGLEQKILEFEQQCNEKRKEFAKEFLMKQVNTKIMTDDDLMAIYACLSVKARTKRKQYLDNVIKGYDEKE